MSYSFSLPAGLIVAELNIDAAGVYGTGRAELPVLIVPLRVLLRGPREPGRGIDFRELRSRISPFDGTYIASSSPVAVDILAGTGLELPDRLLHLEIPLDRIRLALLERMRKGGDVKLRLDCELLVDELVEVGDVKQMPNPSVWGLRTHHRLHSQVQVVIPRSTWVERVLPQTGFGQVHILELPAVPIESCAGLKAAFEALQQAQKLEREGYYIEAIGMCRKALEPFFESVEKTNDKGEKIKVPVLKASWELRLGKAAYDWLNTSLIALKGPTNQALHLSSTIFGQLEAQMFLLVTTAVVSYAVKTQPEPS